MASFSPAQVAVADGWSAIRAPTFLMSLGNLFLKYANGPSCQPSAFGEGLKEFGRLVGPWN